MGDPQDSCFKQKISPFITWVNTTTTTTTTVPPGTVSPEFDFFIIPSSGGWCPVPQIGPNNQISSILLEPPIQNDSITSSCESNYYENNSCTINFLKYIEVATITLDAKICSIYKLQLSGQDKDYFVINNLKLYILGSVLDFDQPSQEYNVTINLVNPLNFEIIDYINHTVVVDNTCECIPLTTTTTSTTPIPQILSMVKTNAGTKRWSGVYSSSDGSILAAVCLSSSTLSEKERIRISYDGGLNWTECENTYNSGWLDINGSSDGSILFAAAYDDYIYKSSNSGVTWYPLSITGKKRWGKIVCSNDGTIIAVTIMRSNKILVSTNGGIFWTFKTVGSINSSIKGISMSSDGSIIVAIGPTGIVYRSTNYGSSWTEVFSRLQQYAFDENFGYESEILAGSSDCSKLISSSKGYVYVSSNSGASWAKKNVNQPFNRHWINFLVSDNGNNILAINSGDTSLYRSANSGESWTTYTFPSNVWTISLSAGVGQSFPSGPSLISGSVNCNKFVLTNFYYGDIYTGEFV